MKKVAIIGTVPMSKRIAPYNDPTWDIWVCSPGNSQGGAPPRITAWFELHSLVDLKGPESAAWWPHYMNWLNSQTFPLFMQERSEEFPRATPFPRKTILQKWGPSDKRTNWFTSSPAWMFAYAMLLGAPEIGIFGVDMAASEEHYSWQKAGLLRMFEFAREAGIKVTIPLESSLSMGAPMYGYAEQSYMGRSLIVREFELKENVKRLETELQGKMQELSFHRGALEQVLFDRRTYVSGFDDCMIDESDQSAAVSPYGQIAAEAATNAVLDNPAQAMYGAYSEQNGVLVPCTPVPHDQAPSAEDFEDSVAKELLPPAAKNKRANGKGART
jgi:hypothetical protein